jgi:hypothetical protein
MQGSQGGGGGRGGQLPPCSHVGCGTCGQVLKRKFVFIDESMEFLFISLYFYLFIFTH